MKPTLLVGTIVLVGLAACAGPTEDERQATDEAAYNENQPGLSGLFRRSLSGTLDIPRSSREDAARIEFSSLGLYSLKEPIAMGGYYLSEGGSFTVDEEHSTLTLTPNGGGAARTYDVAFSFGESNGSYTSATVLLRSANGTFRLKGMVEDAHAAALPKSTFAALDDFARRFVGRSRGTIDVPRLSYESDAHLVFTEDGLFELLEPRAGGGFYLSDRGTWTATAGAEPDAGTLTLVGNMGSGTRAYDVQIGTEDGKTYAVLRSAAGAFKISLR